MIEVPALFLVWTSLFAIGCIGWAAGEIYELRKELREIKQAEIDDLNARDAWADQQDGAA